MSGLTRLAEALHDTARITFRLHVTGCDYPFWEWVLPFCEALRSRLGPDRDDFEVRFRVEAPIFEAPEESMVDTLIRNKVEIRHLLSDPALGMTISVEKELDAVQRAAELGLRLPTIAYVHAGNADAVEERLERFLEASLNSGFGLRPLSSHPDYGVSVDGEPVETGRYLRLTQSQYKRFPYYDDVLEPVSQVAERLANAADTPTIVRLLLEESSELFLYRKIPRQGERIGPALAPENVDRAAFRSRILETSRSPSNADVACATCSYWELCGGVDRPRTERKADVLAADLECSARLLLFDSMILEGYYVAAEEEREIERRNRAPAQNSNIEEGLQV